MTRLTLCWVILIVMLGFSGKLEQPHSGRRRLSGSDAPGFPENSLFGSWILRMSTPSQAARFEQKP